MRRLRALLMMCCSASAGRSANCVLGMAGRCYRTLPEACRRILRTAACTGTMLAVHWPQHEQSLYRAVMQSSGTAVARRCSARWAGLSEPALFSAFVMMSGYGRTCSSAINLKAGSEIGA